MAGLAVVLFSLVFAFAAEAKTDDDTPVFAPSYQISGVINTTYATEYFVAWYDKGDQRSCANFEEDLHRTYNFPGEEVFFRITNKTTSNGTVTCERIYGTDENPITMGGLLPDLSKFQFAGSEDIGNVYIDKWEWLEDGPHVLYRFRHSMWITRMEKPTGDLVVPVQYQVHVTNRVSGEETLYYSIKYDDFKPRKIRSSACKLPLDPNECNTVDNGL